MRKKFWALLAMCACGTVPTGCGATSSAGEGGGTASSSSPVQAVAVVDRSRSWAPHSKAECRDRILAFTRDQLVAGKSTQIVTAALGTLDLQIVASESGSRVTGSLLKPEFAANPLVADATSRLDRVLGRPVGDGTDLVGLLGAVGEERSVRELLVCSDGIQVANGVELYRLVGERAERALVARWARELGGLNGVHLVWVGMGLGARSPLADQARRLWFDALTRAGATVRFEL